MLPALTFSSVLLSCFSDCQLTFTLSHLNLPFALSSPLLFSSMLFSVQGVREIPWQEACPITIPAALHSPLPCSVLLSLYACLYLLSLLSSSISHAFLFLCSTLSPCCTYSSARFIPSLLSPYAHLHSNFTITLVSLTSELLLSPHLFTQGI